MHSDSSSKPKVDRWPGYEAMADAILTPENLFRTAALGGDNCFLTGAGGTGKSTQLREFIGESLKRVDVTAPTGVAALNVGGMTIHRFCGMLIGPAAGQSNEDYFAQLQRDPRRSILAGFNRVRHCEVLVIDEVSMLPGRQLEFVEFLFRRLRGRNEPFGGCQVIATGDFLQLPPVRTSETEPYDWAFQSPAWTAAGFRTFVLEKVRRQDEAAFVRALADFCLLIVGCGMVIYWLVKQLQTVIADHKELREAHHDALAQIIEKQNETAMKLAVCIDRNSEALRECAFELRRFQEGASRTGH